MSVDSADLVLPVVVQRWRRYGHDRAYVKAGDRDLGFRDLKSGAVHCDRPDLLDTVTEATAALFDRAQSVAAAQAYVPRHGAPDAAEPDAATPDAATPDAAEPAPQTVPAEVVAALLPDRDLARNRPGEAVRQIAVELRDAAPVRTLIARVVGAKTDERAHRIGADGEVEVARRLERLGPQWRVLHAIPVGNRGSDIDHVVIGPGGVFTVNAKNHPQANVWVGGDTVKVNGHNQPYVRNSRHEARRAAKLLTAAAGVDVEVRGIVAIMGAHRGFTVKEQPRDGAVSVVTRKRVAEHLLSVPVVLDPPSVERIYDAARHLATWQPTTVRRDDLDVIND